MHGDQDCLYSIEREEGKNREKGTHRKSYCYTPCQCYTYVYIGVFIYKKLYTLMSIKLPYGKLSCGFYQFIPNTQ